MVKAARVLEEQMAPQPTQEADTHAVPEVPPYLVRHMPEASDIQQMAQVQDGSRSKLPAVLGTPDLTIMLVLIVVFVSNINGVQFGGPAAFLYWILGLLTFLLPCALVTQWLARRISAAGGGAPYQWVRHSLGPRWSFISAFCIWLPGVLAVVSVLDNMLIFIQELLPTWFVTPLQQCAGIVIILLVVTSLTCLSLRKLRYVLLVLGILYLSVFALLGVIGFWWLETGHPPATTFNVASTWQFNAGNFPLYGLIILAFLGVSIPLFMSGAVRGGQAGIRRASSYVWWGSALAFLAYMAGTFGIMVIVPANQSGNMTASVQAVEMALGPLAGTVVDIVLVLSQGAITAVYILTFAQALLVVAQDHRLPQSLTIINRYGVPVRSIIVQALVVAIVTILSFVAVPALFGAIVSAADLAVEIYNVMQAGTAVVWICSIMQIFIIILLYQYRRRKRSKAHPHLMKRQLWQRVLLISASLIGIGASLIGIWDTITSSWIASLIPNNRWAMLILIVISLSFMIGWLGSELPRMHALLGEQQRVTDREVALRAQLQETYDEQEILVAQQQVLLAEVNRLYREQAQAAITDAVTGLPNHRAVMSRLQEEISRCQRMQGSCAVLFVDLDHFKRINDTYGHRAGDAILHEVGARLRNALRLEDFVGRYGGEEFALMLTDIDLNGASQTAERLRSAIASEPCKWAAEDSQEVFAIAVTGSFGVAIYGLHGMTREELVEYADRAMYQAKHSGRNCVCIADVEMVPMVKEPGQDEVMQVCEQDIIHILTAIALVHDFGTDAHAHRLVRLAELTASHMQLSQQESQLIRLAALFHDIGKVGVPDAILHKPSSLSSDEWKIMRRHPEIGRQILEQAGGIFQQLASIVVAHHERWDGQGYPHGLAGEDIPICARIITVVDSFDAMTSRRSYREPLSIAEARAELQHCAGTQFDPQVVATFLHVLDTQSEEQRTLETALSD